MPAFYNKNIGKNMAKILKKIPKRKNGKYANDGKKANEILSKIYTFEDFLDSKMKNELSNLAEEDQQYILNVCQKLADGLNFISCVEVSYRNLNGLNVLQNAEKNGLTDKMTKEQINILQKMSRNTSLARILFATKKCSSYIIFIIALWNFYIYTHMQFLYKMIQPEETFVFIGILLVIIGCIKGEKLLATNTANKLEQLIDLKTR